VTFARENEGEEKAAAVPESAGPVDEVAGGGPFALGASGVGRMLALQRTAGNVAARRLAARIPAAASKPKPKPRPRTVARQHVQTVSGRYVGDLEGAHSNVREDVLRVLDQLHRLWSIDNAQYATEYGAVGAHPENDTLHAGDIPFTIAALRRNSEESMPKLVAQDLLGLTLDAPAGIGAHQSNTKHDILALQDALHSNWNLTNDSYNRERTAVNTGPDPVDNSTIPETLHGIGRFKEAFVAGTSRRDGVMGGTTLPTPQQSADREAALITPGTATVTTTVGGVTTTRPASFVDVVSVGGHRRSYRDDLWAEMDAVVGWMFPQSEALLRRPRIAMSSFEAIGQAAKEQVDQTFGASGAFGPRFHNTGPDANLLDASMRAGISAQGLIDYLVDNQQELGVVRARHNAVHSPGRPETLIAQTFKTDYVAHGTNRHKLEIIDQAWPALNSGGVVSIQPFEGATPAATRRVRWEAFQTMIHEYFHSLTHPNFYRIARQLGGDQESVLIEGGASLMTNEAWNVIFPRIRADAGLRASVEGHAAAFDASVIPPISNAHYHPQFEQCQDIQNSFGAPNFRAAILDGRMDLIGYPTTSPASAGAASGTQQFTVPPTGVRTLADVAYMTASPVEEIARLNGLSVNAVVRPRDVLLVPGMP
jgi:hypothetical protein